MKYQLGVFFIVVAVILTADTSWAKELPQNKLKILSFNFNAETLNMHLQHQRLPIFEKYLQEKDPDIVAVQESWHLEGNVNFATIVAQDMDMDVVYHNENGIQDAKMVSISILAKKSLHLREVVALKLPHSAVTFGNGETTWWSLGETNYLIGGRITLKDGSDGFFWTAHLNGPSQEYRLDQVKAIYQQMTESANKAGYEWDNATVFFTGDLNASPAEPAMQFLTHEMRMKDAWLQAHPDDLGFTDTGDPDLDEYNPMQHGAILVPPQNDFNTNERIDYIYSHIPKQKYKVGITRVFTKPINNIWMTDHFGLLSDFIFEEEGIIPMASCDSTPGEMAPTVRLLVDEDFFSHWQNSVNLKVATHRGFTFMNRADTTAAITFIGDNTDHIYTDSKTAITHDQLVSFAFDTSGVYHFILIVRHNSTHQIQTLEGTLDVQLP
jgi:endonuclease/exonuclease/phosphatase family metal-dependent hydrolase